MLENLFVFLVKEDGYFWLYSSSFHLSLNVDVMPIAGVAKSPHEVINRRIMER
jgi:hypothetical protein